MQTTTDLDAMFADELPQLLPKFPFDTVYCGYENCASDSTCSSAEQFSSKTRAQKSCTEGVMFDCTSETMTLTYHDAPDCTGDAKGTFEAQFGQCTANPENA